MECEDGNGDGIAHCDIGAVEAGIWAALVRAVAQPGPIDFGNATVNTTIDAEYCGERNGSLPWRLPRSPWMGDGMWLTLRC